jgi:hypothetical protein
MESLDKKLGAREAVTRRRGSAVGGLGGGAGDPNKLRACKRTRGVRLFFFFLVSFFSF